MTRPLDHHSHCALPLSDFSVPRPTEGYAGKLRSATRENVISVVQIYRTRGGDL